MIKQFDGVGFQHLNILPLFIVVYPFRKLSVIEYSSQTPALWIADVSNLFYSQKLRLRNSIFINGERQLHERLGEREILLATA